MAEPDWNPDTGGRSLAEILREAGIESADRAANRRRLGRPRGGRDPPAAGRGGRRRPDRRALRPPQERPRTTSRPTAPAGDRARVARRAGGRRARDPSTAAIPGLRPDRKPGVPRPVDGRIPELRRPPAMPGRAGPAPAMPERARRRTAARAEPPRRRAGERPGRERAARARTAPDRRRPRPVEPHPHDRARSPSSAPERLRRTPTTSTRRPQESALAWLRFAGELVIALAAGVGRLLRRHAAVGEHARTSPCCWRRSRSPAWSPASGRGGSGRGASRSGPRLLAVLVFAGTLLTIAPAAGLLAGG